MCYCDLLISDIFFHVVELRLQHSLGELLLEILAVKLVASRLNYTTTTLSLIRRAIDATKHRMLIPK